IPLGTQVVIKNGWCRLLAAQLQFCSCCLGSHCVSAVVSRAWSSSSCLIIDSLLTARGLPKIKKGRKGGHKGRVRQYTSPEEIDAQLQAEKQKANEEDEQEEGGDGASGDPKKEKKSLDSDESEDEDDDYQQKRKGVEGLIDIENPNRVAQTTKKVTQLDLDGPKELSRREREEIEKQKAKERYMKMHLAGKTEQAKADLARLAIIRKQREEAARKKEEERKAKDDATLSGKRMQSLSLNK
uniref:PDGFA associated protein 1 n=1 Tax=Rattus norvegicus TaxID=10116 RepID=A0A8I6A1E1_RAT